MKSDCTREDRKDWYAENNHGVRNFGLEPTCAPLSKMRHNVGLHMPYVIALKTLNCFRQHVELHDDDSKVRAFLRNCGEILFT